MRSLSMSEKGGVGRLSGSREPSQQSPLPSRPDGFDLGRLVALAEWCEAATGPDRELDAAIASILGLPHGPDGGWCNNENGDHWSVDECAADFTASLDAAMTLRPEGWLVKAVTQLDFDEGWQCQMMRPISDPRRSPIIMADYCGNAALALCAAALRARAAQ